MLNFVIEFVFVVAEAVAFAIRQERLPQIITNSTTFFATTTVPFLGLLLW